MYTNAAAWATSATPFTYVVADFRDKVRIGRVSVATGAIASMRDGSYTFFCPQVLF